MEEKQRQIQQEIIYKSAQKYIQSGFSILPVKSDKSPAIKRWIKVNINENEFINAHGIGVKCGEESGFLECFDFDNHFGDAKKVLSDFINQPQVNEIYEKYRLPISSTQSGGFHLLIRCKSVEGNKKLASRPKWVEEQKKFRPDAIIETRGEGGYFVAAPTEGYRQVRNSVYKVPEITISERKVLIDTAKSFNQWADVKRNEHEDGNKPGDVYNSKPESIQEMKSELLSAGWTELNRTLWRRPGKKDGISATVGKVADNVFYCFTSNGYPFEPNSGYTPFQVVGLLKYNGDFKQFAKDISERYELNKYQNNKEPFRKKEEKPQKTEKELDELLSKSFIDVQIPIEKPPVILEINHGDKVNRDFKRLLTLGNISTITGKGKSKKTFLTRIILAAMATNDVIDHKFKANLPENKRVVLSFDTEQGEYDSWVVASSIHDMCGDYMQHLGTFCLREHEPEERLQLIEVAIEKWKDQIGFILIDGVADLIYDFNSVDESVKIVTKLMTISKKYNCHIMNIIHQNKGDNYATGHLGSALIKKSEAVIGVEKDKDDKNYSIVSCQNIRGAQDFDDFMFYIDENAMPKISWDNRINQLYNE